MKVLDLFCCAGGASMGYSLAGFELTGVDIKDQPNYPFTFIKGDVMEILKDRDFLSRFDFIHASPPCQGYSNFTKDDSVYVYYSSGKQTPKLIAPVREVLKSINKPYAIENVAGAAEDMINPIYLTGCMFNLPIRRKRLFECNFPVEQPKSILKRGYVKRYADEHGLHKKDMTVTGKSRNKGCLDTWRKIMDISWMKRGWELTEAIPPAYSHYIAQQFLKYHESNFRI